MHTTNKKRRSHHTNPFLNQLFTDVFNVNINDIMGSDWAHTSPAVNIFETTDGYNLEVAAPGLSKSDFTVNIEKNVITISAEKEVTEERKVKRREFDFGKFSRKFTLPETVDTKAISAKHENGVLILSLPKKEEAKDTAPRTVDIS